MAQDCLSEGLHFRFFSIPCCQVDWSLEENLQSNRPQGIGAAPGRAQHPATIPGYAPDALGSVYFPLQFNLRHRVLYIICSPRLHAIRR